MNSMRQYSMGRLIFFLFPFYLSLLNVVAPRKLHFRAVIMYPITNFDVRIDVNHGLMHRDGLSRCPDRALSFLTQFSAANTFHAELPARKLPVSARYKEAFSLEKEKRIAKDVLSSARYVFSPSNRSLPLSRPGVRAFSLFLPFLAD